MDKNTDLITAAQVREQLGGISDMTLYRWVHDQEMGFPHPLYIRRNRYWRLADIEQWLDKQKPKRVRIRL